MILPRFKSEGTSAFSILNPPVSLPWITGVMACGPDGAIGLQGQLPWDYPEELAFFRQVTLGVVNIMGHRTFQNVPPHFIEKRHHVVFSKTPRVSENPRVTYVSGVEEFLKLPDLGTWGRCVMIGGGILAQLFLKHNLLSDFLLSHIKKPYPGDTFFDLTLMQDWPTLTIRDTPDFIIKHYTNPLRNGIFYHGGIS